MWLRRRRRPDDFADEIQSHLDLEADELTHEGARAEEARLSAHRRFGNVTVAQERFYESRRRLWIDHLLQDIRTGWRSLRKYPVASAMAVLSLAGGIGATSATLAVRRTVFTNPPPLYEQPQDLSVVFTITPRGLRRGVPAGLVAIWTRSARIDQPIAAAGVLRREEVRTGDRLETLPIRAVTSNLFAVLGVRPTLGRTLAERGAGDSPPVVIAHRIWQTQFAGRADVIGQPLWIGDQAYTIVGVMPERFWFVGMESPVWTVLELDSIPSETNLEVVVRRASGVTPAGLLEGLNPGLSSYARTLPQLERSLLTRVEDIGGTPISRSVSKLFPWLLSACVLLTLLIACANVAILMIAQWTAREHEIAVRASIGASRARIVQLLLTEALLIALGGGALGLGVMYRMRAILLHAAGPAIRFNTSVGFDLFLQSTVAAVLAGVLTGIGPALSETRRLHVNPLRAKASDRVRQRWRHALVVSEITATVALLVVAATMADGYRRHMSADMGFPSRSLIVLRIENPHGIRPARLVDVLKQVTGVRAVAAGTTVPMMRGAPPQPVGVDTGGMNIVAAERSEIGVAFFETLGVPLRAGREFSTGDGGSGDREAIVNETLAAQLWPGRSPIGRELWLGERRYDIVGIVADYRLQTLGPQMAAVFTPLAENTGVDNLQFLIRANTISSTAIATIRREMQRDGSGHTVTSAFAVDDVIAVGGQEMLAGTAPLVPLVAIGVVLTASGIYGVLAFAIARRSKELALRVAIGATAGHLLRLVVAQSTRLVILGTGLGILFTFGLTRLVRVSGGAGSMFDTPDWRAFAVPVLIVVAVGGLATWFPSRRALHIDPAVLLRTD